MTDSNDSKPESAPPKPRKKAGWKTKVFVAGSLAATGFGARELLTEQPKLPARPCAVLKIDKNYISTEEYHTLVAAAAKDVEQLKLIIENKMSLKDMASPSYDVDIIPYSDGTLETKLRINQHEFGSEHFPNLAQLLNLTITNRKIVGTEKTPLPTTKLFMDYSIEEMKLKGKPLPEDFDKTIQVVADFLKPFCDHCRTAPKPREGADVPVLGLPMSIPMPIKIWGVEVGTGHINFYPQKQATPTVER